MRPGRTRLSALLTLLVAGLAARAPLSAQQHRPPAEPQPTVVILVRHAEKDRSDPRAHDPVLTPAGQRRARDLVRALRRYRLNAIVTTDLKRALFTAQPAAERFGVTPTVQHATSDGRATGVAMAQLIRAGHMGQTVLVVGHANTIPATIEALGGPRLGGDLCDAQFSQMFILVLRPNLPPALSRTHYGAADPPAGRSCANGLQR